MAEVKKELKTCPFCGGKASINYERIPGENKGFWAQVICNACHGRSGGTWAGSYNAAERIEAKARNRRANEPTAYDPYKVMKQLEEEAKGNCVRNSDNGRCPYIGNNEIDCEKCVMLRAIEIVKAGGVDE